MHRRDVLRAGGAAILGPSLAGLLAACGKAEPGPGAAAASGTGPSGATARSSVAPRKVKLGFIALTDCASIVMAKALGYFSERDLDASKIKIIPRLFGPPARRRLPARRPAGRPRGGAGVNGMGEHSVRRAAMRQHEGTVDR